MKIEKLLLQNFRSFGREKTTLRLDDLTAFVGANGAGKTSALLALVRMFGLSTQERTLQPADFFVPVGTSIDDEDQRSLVIEVHLAIPELDGTGMPCPPVFQQMLVGSPGGAPYCRIRLSGTWTAGPTPEGEIEQSLCWIHSTDPEPKPDHVSRVAQSDRAHLQVHYIPATRDPIRQLRAVSTTVLARLLRAVEWSDDLREVLADAAKIIVDAFAEESGMKTIASAIGDTWAELSAGAHYHDIALRPATSRLEDWLRKMEIAISPAPDAPSAGVDRLSEGQKSLFYISLIAAAFSLEESVATGAKGVAVAGLKPDVLLPPALSLLAIEEPENHLSPHYLGRIKRAMDRVANSRRGQIIYTSHAPSMLTRLEPEYVRHFRLHATDHTTRISEIVLPAKDSDVHTYVREAVRAFPELYFARVVVLGEGDSEQIVLPRLAEARGEQLDPSFVSVVPLGGRHVNHFWKLLTNLEIPFVTLLDLDRERAGGGWSRIHYAITQLIAQGSDRNKLLTVTAPAGKTRVLSEPEFEAMKTWPLSPTLESWVTNLEEHGVYFSGPLDLDFLLLRAFPTAYKSTVPKGGGPRIPSTPPDLAKRLETAARSVLKDEGGDGATYSPDEKADFPWYVNLFLTHSKPTTHLVALASLQDAQLTAGMPPVLERLLDRVAELVEPG